MSTKYIIINANGVKKTSEVKDIIQDFVLKNAHQFPIIIKTNQKIHDTF